MRACCTPDCAGKECGGDGCAGSCGACPCPGCDPDAVDCQDSQCVLPPGLTCAGTWSCIQEACMSEYGWGDPTCIDACRAQASAPALEHLDALQECATAKVGEVCAMLPYSEPCLYLGLLNGCDNLFGVCFHGSQTCAQVSQCFMDLVLADPVGLGGAVACPAQGTTAAQEEFVSLFQCVTDACEGQEEDLDCGWEAMSGACAAPAEACLGCLPDCVGKQCGPDPCVGSCGTCDDDDPCTLDACADSVAGTCAFTPSAALDGEPCDLDWNACTLDTCSSGACAAGPPATCPDTGVSCLGSFCEEKGAPGSWECVEHILMNWEPCSLPNAELAQCLETGCAVQTCTAGTLNQNGLDPDGCECLLDVWDEETDCLGAPGLGTATAGAPGVLPDTVFATAKIVGAFDEDWFMAGSIRTSGLCPETRFAISTEEEGAPFLMAIYREGCSVVELIAASVTEFVDDPNPGGSCPAGIDYRVVVYPVFTDDTQCLEYTLSIQSLE